MTIYVLYLMTAICAVAAVVTASVTIRGVLQSSGSAKEASISLPLSKKPALELTPHTRPTEFLAYHRRTTFAFSSDDTELPTQHFRQGTGAVDYTVIEQLGAEVEFHLRIDVNTVRAKSLYRQGVIDLRLLNVETIDRVIHRLIIPLKLNTAGDRLIARVVLDVPGESFNFAVDGRELSIGDLSSFTIGELFTSISSSVGETRASWEELAQMSFEEPSSRAVQSLIRGAL